MNLNRVFIELKSKNKGLINFNYQYELLQKLYKSVEAKDKPKSIWLHNEGYKEDKKFKLFNTCLIFENQQITNEGIHIEKDDSVQLMISGYDEVLNIIIKSLIDCKEFNISNITFKTENLQQDKSIKFKRIMLYKVLTQVVESKWEDGKIKYLNPYMPEFYETLVQNLKRKYKLIYSEEFKDEIFFDIENVLTIKEKNIRNIKNGGYLKGYGKFNIWIETSTKMQKVAYYLGLGQNNTLGAGTLQHLVSK